MIKFGNCDLNIYVKDNIIKCNFKMPEIQYLPLYAFKPSFTCITRHCKNYINCKRKIKEIENNE